MKVKIELDESLQEEEFVIRCSAVTEDILKVQAAVMDLERSGRCMDLRQGDTEYYLPIGEILFFETEHKTVYAHTRDKMLETGYRLYELEELLPGSFFRISKSAIVNLNQIYSITRNLASSSLVEFMHSHKRVYVSRKYYKLLVERLAEKRKRL